MGIPKPSLLLSSEDKEQALSLEHTELVTAPVEGQTALEVDEKRQMTKEQQAAKEKVIRSIKRKILDINKLTLSVREKKRRIEQMTKKQKARHPDLFKTEKVKK